MTDGPGFEAIERETVFEGAIFSVEYGRFRHDDGGEATREKVHHDGAVGVVAYDDEHLYLVRQPREAIDRSDVLELPAGRLDVEGEEPLAAAQRELAEEIGLAADSWQHATTYFSSAGFTDEQVHVFLATGLRKVDQPEVEEEERIELVRWPLVELDAAIDTTLDAKTLIGLLWLRRAREEGAAAG
ncbi:MAG: NUDIX hydrolase [Solirubrobacteraceae bacterium MAG38_C4-C5]|nr:NUDIX hydrolase [Candidatus Siliceabacter maunaloa]